MILFWIALYLLCGFLTAVSVTLLCKINPRHRGYSGDMVAIGFFWPFVILFGVMAKGIEVYIALISLTAEKLKRL